MTGTDDRLDEPGHEFVGEDERGHGLACCSCCSCCSCCCAAPAERERAARFEAQLAASQEEARGLAHTLDKAMSELRDARAEAETETQRLNTRMMHIEDSLRARLRDAQAEVVSWRNAYEEAVQRAEQAEADLSEAKEQHAIDENELVENTVKAHVRQMNVVAAELAAERAKVEAANRLLLTKFYGYDTRDLGRAYDADSVDELLADLRAALAGGEQGE